MTQLQPHQQRVVDEKTQNDERLQALTKFTHGEIFPTLDDEDKDLLLIQRAIMASLSRTLGARIKRFTQETVKVPKKEYEDLLEAHHWLNCLENAGVDNWDGIDEARVIYRETGGDDE